MGKSHKYLLQRLQSYLKSSLILAKSKMIFFFPIGFGGVVLRLMLVYREGKASRNTLVKKTGQKRREPGQFPALGSNNLPSVFLLDPSSVVVIYDQMKLE